MTNKAIASVLKETASLIELTGGNPFRSRALSSAARTIERLEDPVSERIRSGSLTEIPGIGAGLENQISELLDRGSFELRDDLLGAIPPGLLDVLSVKGLGAKKVRVLWRSLSIQTLDDLEAAASMGRIETLDGFGKKSQHSIAENAAALRRYRRRRHYADTRTRINDILDGLDRLDGVEQVLTVGELARRTETIGQAELLLSCSHFPSQSALETVTGPLESIPSESGTFSGTLGDGLPLLLFCVSDRFAGSVSLKKSASASFLEGWCARFGPIPDSADEEAIFTSSNVDFIPPELRENGNLLDTIIESGVPQLITTEDLRGSLHNHSHYSDGAHSLREMTDATRALGLDYFGICDHSQSLRIANGMPVDRVREQHDEIRSLNAEYERDSGKPFKVFAGIESDILSDGALDYTDDILAEFDFVVASVHTGFNMSEKEATDRIITAVRNPFTSILGHPTGRLLLRREGYPLNHLAVLDACAACNVSIELNANPYRLDLDWRWIREARDRGVLISINPDAHSIEQLAYVKWGVAVARKGMLTRHGCLNALPLDRFEAWITSRLPLTH